MAAAGVAGGGGAGRGRHGDGGDAWQARGRGWTAGRVGPRRRGCGCRRGRRGNDRRRHRRCGHGAGGGGRCRGQGWHDGRRGNCRGTGRGCGERGADAAGGGGGRGGQPGLPGCDNRQAGGVCGVATVGFQGAGDARAHCGGRGGGPRRHGAKVGIGGIGVRRRRPRLGQPAAFELAPPGDRVGVRRAAAAGGEHAQQRGHRNAGAHLPEAALGRPPLKTISQACNRLGAPGSHRLHGLPAGAAPYRLM